MKQSSKLYTNSSVVKIADMLTRKNYSKTDAARSVAVGYSSMAMAHAAQKSHKQSTRQEKQSTRQRRHEMNRTTCKCGIVFGATDHRTWFYVVGPKGDNFCSLGCAREDARERELDVSRCFRIRVWTDEHGIEHQEPTQRIGILIPKKQAVSIGESTP